MGKYLLLWEIDRTRIPVDPKERQVGFTMLAALVREDMKKGLTKDWGAYVGSYKGYCVVEGTEVEVIKQLQRYTPFVYFESHPLVSLSQAEEMIKALTK